MRTKKPTERNRVWGRGGSGASTSACSLFLFCALTAIASNAQTFTTLVSFDLANGSQPYASLVQGLDGNLYGTTSSGGANSSGTVFKVTTAGQLTTLYSFCINKDCTDGAVPLAALVQAPNGYLYGTTAQGGTHGIAGTAFKITPRGEHTTLYSFCARHIDGACADGGDVQAGLVQASNRDFYGTTVQGGIHKAGTVFKITPKGALTTLHSFCSLAGCEDGDFPFAPLIQATNGDFYGTTYEGGGSSNAGAVFRITPAGTLTTLYSFCAQTNCTDGSNPYAGLIQSTDGNFYGTTSQGGANGFGTVFRITSAGKLTTLYSFCAQTNCPDGANPSTGLVQATDGNFYGTTGDGGTNGDGTIFKLTATGTLTTLHTFVGSDGYSPNALAQFTSGALYGTTSRGGANSYGTVFRLDIGLSPFVETLPTSGKVGASVKILGTKLTGTTSITFNGTPATFTVVSSSEITTTVPTGATTGKVEVITPHEKLSSNMPFRVTN
jgi:uncharacterized repeat protein (TIGR03803 family)